MHDFTLTLPYNISSGSASGYVKVGIRHGATAPPAITERYQSYVQTWQDISRQSPRICAQNLPSRSVR